MAHFYGTLQGNRGEATRMGSKASGIETWAASWAGAVSVHAYFNEYRDEDWVMVTLRQWHSVGQYPEKVLYHGPIGRYAPGGDENDE